MQFRFERSISSNNEKTRWHELGHAVILRNFRRLRSRFANSLTDHLTNNRREACVRLERRSKARVFTDQESRRQINQFAIETALHLARGRLQ